MKSLKVLMVGFLSVALSFVFIPGPLAQDLVYAAPEFYYLEDLGDDVSVHACSQSMDGPNTANLSTLGLSCTVVAEVRKRDLKDFLVGLAIESDFADSSYSPVRHLLSVVLLFGGAGTFGWNLAAFLSSKAGSSGLFAIIGLGALVGGIVLNGHYIDIRGDEENNSDMRTILAQQIRTGVVGEGAKSEAHRLALQKFTDFVNKYGLRPSAVASVVPQ